MQTPWSRHAEIYNHVAIDGGKFLINKEEFLIHFEMIKEMSREAMGDSISTLMHICMYRSPNRLWDKELIKSKKRDLRRTLTHGHSSIDAKRYSNEGDSQNNTTSRRASLWRCRRIVGYIMCSLWVSCGRILNLNRYTSRHHYFLSDRILLH